jgi:GT2 family glycosyltransferase
MLYIILPTYNNRHYTDSIRKQLEEQTYQDYELIIIESGETLHEPNDKTWIYYENYLWSKSVNVGFDHVKCYARPDDKVCIMNADIKIPKTFLDKNVSLTEHYLLVTGESRTRIDWKKFKFTKANEYLGKDYFTTTRGLFLTVNNFLTIGKFSKRLPHYLSDTEFTYRAVKKGYFIMEGEQLETFEQKRSKGVFSKFNPGNPYYFTIFILMHCPKKYIPLNILKVWIYSLINLFK